jgi:putative peptide maturation system protein
MSLAFDNALADAASLLRELPHERTAVNEAHQRFDEFLRAHSGVSGALAVDLQPGRDQAEYDVLLDSPEGGTVAVTYKADGGTPWLAEYAEHWAANYVVSVGEAHLSVQDALISLRLAANEHSGLAEVLLDHAIIAQAIEVEEIRSTPSEEQEATDAFRRALGLESAAATLSWLRDRGWSTRQLQLLVSGGVRLRKLQKRIVGDDADSYFAAHSAEFDLMRVVRADFPTESQARLIYKEASGRSLIEVLQTVAGPGADGVEITIRTARARELPPAISTLAVAGVTSGVTVGGRWYVAQVLERRSATLDGSTRHAVNDAIFRSWLDDQRRRATIRWHWV